MKTKSFMALAACSAFALTSFNAVAQSETVVVEEETAVVTDVPCKTHYYSASRDNWFLQLGAGIQSPYVENNGGGKHHFTAAYNIGVGKWFSPYLGWRTSFNYGSMHWNDYKAMMSAKNINGNLDFMWDMFNSLGGVNASRPFSIVPFVGLGGAFTWDYKPHYGGVLADNGHQKHNSWTLPVSAGIQLRFRLCKYVDFFAEGRASFHGDNFNNYAAGKPVDVNITAIGGFSFNLGGAGFRSYNPCDYLGYISNLNNQVNDLRGALATTAAQLAAAEAQLPCPEIVETNTVVVAQPTPLMATVRFKINSARISDEEMVNVYNIAQWMKANPNQNVVIGGYADRNTGTSSYNMALSKRRAEAVQKVLVDKYGINPSRLTLDAQGSNVQPYDVNNWNRIVIFGIGE